MSATLVFLALLMTGFVGWLLRQTIGVQPWVAQSASAAIPMPSGATPARLALGVFLAVVTSVFALTVSAYIMRMSVSPEWQFLPDAPLAWVNTGLLVAASLAMHLAWIALRRQHVETFRAGLLLAVVFTVAFFAGQWLLWRQFDEAGYDIRTFVGSAFFVFMGVLHALHLLGGLAALARLMAVLRRGAGSVRVREAVGLCTIYWHALLLIWLALFVVLFVGAEPLYAWCRS
jgi:cytochrome c oxidase subunit III